MAHVLPTAIVRLLFHQPAFVVLDEATSGLAPDVVSTVYATFEEREIQAITITQALVEPAVPYHTRALYLGECCPSGWQVQELEMREPPKFVNRASSDDLVSDEKDQSGNNGWVSDGWDSEEEPDGDAALVAG